MKSLNFWIPIFPGFRPTGILVPKFTFLAQTVFVTQCTTLLPVLKIVKNGFVGLVMVCNWFWRSFVIKHDRIRSNIVE